MQQQEILSILAKAESCILPCSIVVLLLTVAGTIICIIRIFRSARKNDHQQSELPRGYYYKELPMDTISVSFLKKEDIGFDIGNPNLCMLEILPDVKKDLTQNAEEASKSVKHNADMCNAFIMEFVTMLAGENPCIFDWRNYFSEDDDLRSCYVDEKMRKWFDKHHIIRNVNNEILAVRGISKDTIEMMWEIGFQYNECYCEIIVPDVSEKELCQLNECELERFDDISKCKFKINNGNLCSCYFEFSDTPGYTGAEMCQKIKDLAESRGYKFKIIEK